MRSIFIFNLILSGKDILHAYIYYCLDCLSNGSRSIRGARIFFQVIGRSSLSKIQLRHLLRKRQQGNRLMDLERQRGYDV
jgi:hypothetical protein